MRVGKQVVSQWVWCQWGDCSRRHGLDFHWKIYFSLIHS